MSAATGATTQVAQRASNLRKATVRHDVRRIYEYKSLVRYLVVSGLRTENTGTVFGLLWWILDPVLLMLVYWFLFGVIFHRTEPYFPLFVLISLVSWEFFSKTVMKSMAVTLSRARSMRQVNFPRSVIPIAVSLSEFVHFLSGMLFAVILAAAIYDLHPAGLLVMVIPIGLLQLSFGLGFAYLVSALNFFFRDVSNLLRYLFRAWYLLSPGIYSITRISPKYRGIYGLNPFAEFFRSYHAAILHEQWPSLLSLAYVAGLSLATLGLTYSFYVRVSPHFVKLSA